MHVINIDDYMKDGAELKHGKDAMSAYIMKECSIMGRCPVCIAERVFQFTSTMIGPFTRGKRLVCLQIMRDVEHTCGGKDEKEH